MSERQSTPPQPQLHQQDTQRCKKDSRTVPNSSDTAKCPTFTMPVEEEDLVAKPHSIEPATTDPRLLALQDRHASLLTKLDTLKSARDALVASTAPTSGRSIPEEWNEEQRRTHAMSAANATIKEHIGLLHRYNEIKDIGLGLMALIAESRGVRQVVVMEEYGLSAAD